MEYINIAGQCFSGSSAVINWLYDFKECYSMQTEVDICLREFGVFGMYLMLEQDMPMYGVLDRFATLIDYVAPRINYMEHVCPGLLGEEFFRVSRDFLSRISWCDTRESYTFDLCFINKIVNGCIVSEPILKDPNRQKSRLKLFLFNWIRKKGEIDFKVECPLLRQPKKSYRISINAEEYKKEAKRYLNEYASLFTNTDKFIVNNFFEFEHLRGENFDKLSSFFDKLKIVFVTRDPRDQYISWSKRGICTDERVDDFIRLSKERSWRDFPHRHENMLDIRFEDFVLDHSNTTKKILDFCGISADSKVLNPKYSLEESKKNVGRWKTYPNQKIIARIAERLTERLNEL